jgi:hypothetical protein
MLRVDLCALLLSSADEGRTADERLGWDADFLHDLTLSIVELEDTAFYNVSRGLGSPATTYTSAMVDGTSIVGCASASRVRFKLNTESEYLYRWFRKPSAAIPAMLSPRANFVAPCALQGMLCVCSCLGNVMLSSGHPWVTKA